MRQLFDFIARLFYYSDFEAMWKARGWTGFHGWLYIFSDLLVWAALLALPVLVVRAVRRHGRELPADRLYILFVFFISVLGATFLFDALMFWLPIYRISAVVRLAAGVLCWVMIYYLLQALPTALALRDPEDLQRETDRRSQVEEELRKKNTQLLEAERTAKMGYGHWDIIRGQVVLSEMACNLLGIPHGEVLTYERLSEQVHPADLRFVQDSISKNLKNSTFKEFYFRVLTVQMEVKHVLIKGEVERNKLGEPVLLRGTMQDVSELRGHMQKIEQQNRKLRKIAWVQSHRMRSPVATILGMADLFNHADPADPMNGEILKNIKDLTQKLDAMIHEVDALTRVKERE